MARCRIAYSFYSWETPDHLPGALSGGEKQWVALARALALQPLVLIADEPTGSLDARSAEAVIRLLRQLATEDQRTVLTASHEQRIKSVASRMLQCEDGRVGELATTSGKSNSKLRRDGRNVFPDPHSRSTSQRRCVALLEIRDQQKGC